MNHLSLRLQLPNECHASGVCDPETGLCSLPVPLGSSPRHQSMPVAGYALLFSLRYILDLFGSLQGAAPLFQICDSIIHECHTLQDLGVGQGACKGANAPALCSVGHSGNAGKGEVVKPCVAATAATPSSMHMVLSPGRSPHDVIKGLGRLVQWCTSQRNALLMNEHNHPEKSISYRNCCI